MERSVNSTWSTQTHPVGVCLMFTFDRRDTNALRGKYYWCIKIQFLNCQFMQTVYSSLTCRLYHSPADEDVNREQFGY